MRGISLPMSLIATIFIRLPGNCPKFIWPIFEFQPFYWLALSLLAAGALWFGLHRAQRRSMRIGWMLLAILIVWIGVAWLVVTPRERLAARQNLVVRAAAKDHINTIMKIIAPGTFFGPWNHHEIRTQLSQRLAAAHITGNFIRFYRSDIRDRQAITRITVWTQTRDFGPVLSTWQFDWQDRSRPHNWRIIGIRLLSINHHNVPPGGVIPAVQ